MKSYEPVKLGVEMHTHIYDRTGTPHWNQIYTQVDNQARDELINRIFHRLNWQLWIRLGNEIKIQLK
jgi:hypothetical protein